MCNWVQLRSTWGHVSMAFVWHIVQYVCRNHVGQNKCFLALPIYWYVQNFSNCLICASMIFGLFQKLFESSLWMCSLCVHLLMLENSSTLKVKFSVM